MTATTALPVEKIAVRHLRHGDQLVSGVAIHRVWSGSKTRKGYKTVEMVRDGKFQVTEWNASTQVGVINR